MKIPPPGTTPPDAENERHPAPDISPPVRPGLPFRTYDASLEHVRRTMEQLGRAMRVPVRREVPLPDDATEWITAVGTHNHTYTMLQALAESIATRTGVPLGEGGQPHPTGHPAVPRNRQRALDFLRRVAGLDRRGWAQVLRIAYGAAETPLWRDSVHDLRYACGYWVPGYGAEGLDPALLEAAEIALLAIPADLRPLSVEEFTLQMLLAGAEAVLMNGIVHRLVLDAAYEGFAATIPFNDVVAGV